MSDQPPVPLFCDEQPTEFAVKVQVDLKTSDKVVLQLSEFPSGTVCTATCSIVRSNGKPPGAKVDSLHWSTPPDDIERAFARMIILRVIPECLRVLFQQQPAAQTPVFTNPRALLSLASNN